MLPVEINTIILEFLRGDRKYYRKKLLVSLDILNKWFEDFILHYKDFIQHYPNIETKYFQLFIFNNYIFPDGRYIHGKNYSPLSYRRG